MVDCCVLVVVDVVALPPPSAFVESLTKSSLFIFGMDVLPAPPPLLAALVVPEDTAAVIFTELVVLKLGAPLDHAFFMVIKSNETKFMV